MNILAHKCLERFHLTYTENSSQNVNGIMAFRNMMQGDYSALKLLSLIIQTDESWQKMMETKGLGLAKSKKLTLYRSQLIKNWQSINAAFESQDETAISQIIGLYLWDLDPSTFRHSYLGVVQRAILQNKLWKNPLRSEIFLSFFGFIGQASKNMEQIATEYNIERERVRQLKMECIESFEKDFWFVRDHVFKKKLGELFDLNRRLPEELGEQTSRVNNSEQVDFSSEFYQMILSMSLDMILVGNINDVKNQNSRSATGNIWTHLYLQSQKEYKRCSLEKLINLLAVEMHENNYRFETDTVISRSEFSETPLDEQELLFYSKVIELELINETELLPDCAIIKRNSHVTLPELVEEALFEIGGYAYGDEILDKLIQGSPEKEWTMQSLRATINRQPKIYNVGKSGLFGLVYVKDVRADIGNGTLNEIMRIYLSRHDSPVHLYELLTYVNTIFPRPKNLNTVYTFLLQDSKAYFKKLSGEFYGLKDTPYPDIKYTEVTNVQGKELIRLIKNSEGIRFTEFSEILNQKYGLLEIQVQYLLHLLSRTHNIFIEEDRYYLRKKEILPDYFETNDDGFEDDFPIEISQEELDYEELSQFDVPDELRENTMAQIQIRRGQPKFRLKLLKLYKSTCIVTGCKIPALLEAAHVLPHSIQEDFRVSNGLLLRADIHTLFDLSLIAIDPSDLTLKINQQLADSEEYRKLENLDIGQRLSQLHELYRLNEQGLKYRWECFTTELD